MKYTSKALILLLSMGVAFLTSCVKEKYTTPDIESPQAGFTANLSIAQLKSINTGALQLIGDTIIIASSGDTIVNPVIEGIVNADDESGNIYKTLYLQDNTGGIQIAIDKTSLYTNYKIGQKVLVKCTGMYMGVYGVVQLGYVYDGAIGRLPDALISSHLFKDSLPGPAPIPLERTVTSLSGNDMNMLVRLNKVHFAEVGSVFADVNVTTNRTILDSAGNSIILRNSGYANFRADLLPKGQGNIVGILSEYGGAKQLYIRDLNDIENWDSTITFPTNVINESFASASLGTFTQYSVTGAQVWTASSFGGTTLAKMSGYSGGYFANEDWLISPSVNFDNYTLETFTFSSAMNYGVAGDGSLKVYTSTDYSGSGDPTLATWTEITTATLSTGAWVFTPSGNIDLSGINGTNVHIAFKYTCGTSSVSTWELTSIKLSAKPN